mgnify:CR=1 FL=1
MEKIEVYFFLNTIVTLYDQPANHVARSPRDVQENRFIHEKKMCSSDNQRFNCSY